MADVFISYARSTAGQARAVAQALGVLGYDVWIDDELPSHRAYSDVIEEQLHAAAAVVVIWSNDAAKSEWVRSEANRARGDRKLVQIAVEKTRLPMPFDQLQCADLTGWAGETDHATWRSVVSSIAHLVHGRASSKTTVAGPADAAHEVTSERRHLTVLSCGLVNAAKIAAGLDPEDWRAIAADYRRAAAAAVTEVGGHIAKSGDDMVAYFGYPVAQENAAERAVRAGLAIVEAMGPLVARARREHGVDIAVRIGVDAGTVVVGPGDAGELEVFGDVPGVAAEVRTAAALGKVLMTSEVHDLVSGQFVVEDLGERQLSGALARLYRAIAPALTAGHGRGYSPRTVTPFVGREDEVRLLVGRWEHVREGQGQLVLLTGEAGIGKTRLVEEFRERIRAHPHTWIECGGGPLFTNTTFHPVTRMLEQGLGWNGDETPAERVARLEQALTRAGMKTSEAVPLIAEMLNLAPPETYLPLTMVPEQKRSRLLAVLVQWVLGATRSQPLVVVMEDLHWIDPSTMELIEALAEQQATVPLMLVCTARPEFRAPWPVRGHHSHVLVGRLNARQTQELVAGVISRAGLADDVVNAVIQRTDGVPLFAEELTRLMLEGGGRQGARDIPATLLDSLSARLDRLGPAREAAQLGAVLGREFSYELIAAVSRAPESQLQSALARLADAELIYARGRPPEATYQFKHALVLDAAYAALLRSQRRELHARVAHTITGTFPGLAESHPEVLARHWAEAGEADKAVAAWKQAGQRAASRAAHVEAVEHLGAALELVRRGPEDAARSETELPLLLGLAVSLSASRGYSVPEVGQVLAEARAICDRLGNVAGLYAVLIGICNFYAVTGDLEAAEDAARRCQKIAAETGLAEHRIQVEFVIGYLHYSKGELAEARDCLERAARLYREHDGGKLTFFSPTDPLVESLSTLPIVLYALGETERAAAAADESLRHARARERPYELAYALAFRWVYDTMAGQFDDALRHAEEGLAVCEAGGYSTYRAIAQTTKGLSMGRLGRIDEGLALYQIGIEEMKRMGILRALGLYMGEAVALHLLAGDPEAALTTVDEAIVLAARSLRICLPRLHALRTEIFSRQNDKVRAKAALQESLAMAQAQGAKTFEAEAQAALKAT